MDKLGERLARGDAAAFAELYDACADRLHHYLTVRLGSRDEADDVLCWFSLKWKKAAFELATKG